MKEIEVVQIVAYDDNNLIGINGEFPFKLKGHFTHLNSLINNHPIILSRKVYENLGQVLENSNSPIIVVSREVGVINKPEKAPHYKWRSNSLEVAIDLGKGHGTGRVFILGGGGIFEDTLSITDTIYVSEIQGSVYGDEEDVYTYYPSLEESEWELSETINLVTDNSEWEKENEFKFFVSVYKRIVQC